MHLVTMRVKDSTRAGRLEGARVVELPHRDVGALLEAGEEALLDAQSGDGKAHELGTVSLAPPIPRPGKIFCVGLNYRSHIAEMGRQPDEFPTLFATYADALVGPRDPIELPPQSEQIDWEAELAIVIKHPVRNAGEREAAAAIAGFTIYNDVTARDWQRRTTQWLQGKTFERTSPLGPAVVTVDETGVRPELQIACEIDGWRAQEGSTADLVFDPPSIVRYLSTILTLRPGDVIATGTPAGVGAGLDPPRYLRAGQVVRTSIEGLGELINPCVSLAEAEMIARRP